MIRIWFGNLPGLYVRAEQSATTDQCVRSNSGCYIGLENDTLCMVDDYIAFCYYIDIN
jgi:hypothetical protein